ncbi:MAG TPA: murein biosynthesis integral membrane protein MurJ [Streptosporangiaceae bacterium]|nr:murein biosynthesis integral membrane protein MurJ [Streptosporangiaceae bacterium]
MTPPESDPHADVGGSDWEIRPAVPGWSAGQDYTGPLFDDTGWHIDLSNVEWAGSAAERDQAFREDDDYYGGPGPSWRRDRQDREAGNGAASYPAGRGSQSERTRSWARRPDRLEPPDRQERSDQQGRSSGRHARRARPGEDAPPPAGQRPGPGGQRRAGLPPPRVRARRPDERRSSEPGYPPRDYYDRAGYQRPAYDSPPYDRPPYDRPPYDRPPYDRPPYDAQRTYQPPVRERPVDEPPGYGQPPQRRPGGPPDAQRPGDFVPRGPGSGAGTRPPGAGVVAPDVTGAGAPLDATGSFSIAKSSSVMAIGTLGSRLTGFLRQIVQSSALGYLGIAAAYNLSNTLPNVVYNLALGGILTSVIVPLIVNAARRDSGRREGYDQRMFTLITLALAGVTLLATLAVVPIVHLYAGSKISQSHATLHLAIVFALFFIPQIFFYGVSSLIGAILNARGSFAAPMWTPIVNNAVVIAVLALYIAMAGLKKTPGTISGVEVELLGLGTTLGIVAQTVALLPALRRVGFRWRPRMDFRRAEVAEIGHMAGWMFGYIAATQVAFLVTTKVAGDASVAGITQYNYAWLLFQLPYAVVGISVITALLPRMSAHAADRRFGLVRQDFSSGTRLASAIVVPSSLVLAVLGPQLAEVFLGHGAMTPAQARYIGVVFAVFCLGLLPYTIFQLQLRVFYSLHDSRTPALIGLATMAVNIAANLIALATLHRNDVVAGLGVGFGLANVIGMIVSWQILTRRLRGLDGYRIARSLVRMHAATLPAALIAVLVGIISGNNAIVDVIFGGSLALAMYLIFAKALRIEELTGLSRGLLARLGR